MHANRASWAVLAAAIVLAALAISCTNGAKSGHMAGGHPGEVLVQGDSMGVVEQWLSTPVEGLPQAEPMFDVVRSPRKGTAISRAEQNEHNIIVVDINAREHTTTSVKYRRNVYADGQMIIYICAPSAEMLRRDIARCGVEALLSANEKARWTARLRRRHNAKIDTEIRKTFGCTMLVPEDMVVNKRGREFVWLSDNASPTMLNICIYTSDNRDSVMRINLKGATDSIYMATVPGSVTTMQGRDRHGHTVTTTRGLWQMHGDAMGGPFVARSILTNAAANPCKSRRVVAEAFVYAPGEKKRDKTTMLEASLQSLQFCP